MLKDLTTESKNAASTDLDTLSTLKLVELINSEDAKVVIAVASESGAIAEAIDSIAACIRKGGRLIYVGAGTSGRLGVLDAVECPPTFGTPPEQIVGVMAGGYAALVKAVEGIEDSHESGRAALESLGLNEKDCVVGISASGRTPFVLAAMKCAQKVGAITIGFCCNKPSEIESCSNIIISPVVGPEVISGSTRLKAGTATKLVLNMLTTGAMVRLGKTFGNTMVDVQATNNKLRQRANRMLVDLAGISSKEAATLLDCCEGELKTAVVVSRLKLGPEVARQMLLQAQGSLRVALTSGPGGESLS